MPLLLDGKTEAQQSPWPPPLTPPGSRNAGVQAQDIPARPHGSVPRQRQLSVPYWEM